MTKQTFLQGTLILIAAGMVTRLLGFINRIVVARVMGEEGVGLYMMALPTLILAITLTQFGLPVAISKRVAEAEASGNTAKIKQILIVSLTLTGALSILFTTLMIAGAPIIAKWFLTDVRALYPLMAISPIVPITAISAVIRGYFQGRQNMKPQAVSQVLEQIVRISCVYFLTHLMLPYGIEYAAAGAMFSVIIGELVSLLYMMRMFTIKKSFQLRHKWKNYLGKGKETLNELLSIALPTTGSRLVGSITYFFEPILVAQSLAIAGLTTAETTRQYGELTGYLLPLLFLPTFITHSLSVALIPSISEAAAKGEKGLIQYRMTQSIRLSLASGGLATVVLMVFPIILLNLMYGTANAASLLTFMAPFFLLLYIQAPLQASLQAMDMAKPAMWNSVIGSIVKFVVLIGLASQPQFGIQGVAIAMITGVLVVTFLHIVSLMRHADFQVPWMVLFKTGLLMVILSFTATRMKHLTFLDASTLSQFLPILFILAILYIMLLFILKLITFEELKQLPFKKKPRP
ncbi:stage V sporulation protein B [Thalassobacillus sp. CUG 92003]|uniref:stage V sporulation protein B n=1 Tax=Thalassobacillus sp. CUG 92003 TaxID=2736641 RepID=UPI0015E6DF03|nr:stage V sporulation protein B [Thalassobacillus sp. CUG 92003]